MSLKTVQSKDGTPIAYEKLGQGETLILVGGAFEQRALDSETSKLAAFPLLAEHFTVIHYDRRGRGDSGDTLPYSLEREIEDIEALIDAHGGSAFLFGISSGAALALEAALKLGKKLKKLALYEPPYNDETDTRAAWVKFRHELDTVLAEKRHGDAVILFMQLLGLPDEHIPAVREFPFWPLFEAVAPTIAYDAAALGADASVPTERAAKITIPSLIMDGESTPYPFMQVSALALAEAIPNAQHRTLAGQNHEVTPEAIAPVLRDFFTAS